MRPKRKGTATPSITKGIRLRGYPRSALDYSHHSCPCYKLAKIYRCGRPGLVGDPRMASLVTRVRASLSGLMFNLMGSTLLGGHYVTGNRVASAKSRCDPLRVASPARHTEGSQTGSMGCAALLHLYVVPSSRGRRSACVSKSGLCSSPFAAAQWYRFVNRWAPRRGHLGEALGSWAPGDPSEGPREISSRSCGWRSNLWVQPEATAKYRLQLQSENATKKVHFVEGLAGLNYAA